MERTNPFDAAFAQALQQSSQHDAAIRIIEELAKQLDDAIRRKTAGAVSIDLVPANRASSLVDLWPSLKSMLPPTVGSDSEDREVRMYVVAKAGNERRVLWGVVVVEGGYPVVIDGPETGATLSCFSEEDVQSAFTEAAGHVRVGRKVANLVNFAASNSQRVLVNSTAEDVPDTHQAPPDESDRAKD